MKKAFLLIICGLLFSLQSQAQWTYVSQFGSAGTGDGQFGSINDISLDAAGNVYMIDGPNYRVQKFTSAGVFDKKWGQQGTTDGLFETPNSIDVDNSNNIYVLDEYFTNHRVQKFQPNTGTFLKKWGSYGTGNLNFNWPTDIAFYANSIYVLDMNNARIQKFSLEGDYQGTFNVPANTKVMAIDASGNFYLAPNLIGSISKYNSSGNLVTSWTNPHIVKRLWIDASANVYAVSLSKLFKYSSSGEALAEMPLPVGSGNGQFNGIACLAVDASGNVYLGDNGNKRIQKFSPAAITSVTKSNNTVINQGDTYDWGQVQRFSFDERIFKIKNTGLAPLSINTAASGVTGENASDYVMDKSSFTSPIAPGAEVSFKVTLTPGAVDPSRIATINIVSNDPVKPTYSFNVTAECIKAEQLYTFTPPITPKYGAVIPLVTTSNSGLTATAYNIYLGSDYAHIATVNGVPTLFCDAPGDIQIRVRELTGNADYFNYVGYFPFTIAKGDQTIDFTQPSSKTYGDGAFTLSATSSSALTVALSSSNTNVATINGNTVTIVGAGTTDITASQPGNGNYNAAPNVVHTLTVNTKPVTVTVNANQTKVYGAADPVLTYNVTPSLINGDGFTGTLIRAAGENAGGYNITQGTLSAGNKYNITFVANIFTITKASPVASFTSANGGVYGSTVNLAVNKGGSTGAVSYTVTNGTGSANVNGSVLSLTGAGAITLGATIAADANYNAGSISNYEFTIAKATPLVSITSANTTIYGTSLQLTANKGGSTGAALFSVQTIGTGFGSINGSSVFTPMSAGSLNIILNVAADANYNAASTGQSFTVSPKAVTITGISATAKTYDGTTSVTLSGTAALNGIVAGDNMVLDASAVTAVFSDKNAANNKTVNISGYVISNGNVNPANYSLTQPVLTANINKKSVTITGITAVQKVYDGSTSATITGTPSLTGILAADAGNVTLTSGANTFNTKEVGTSKSVITNYSLSGNASDNYSLVQPAFTANITPKPVTLTVVAGQSKVFGAQEPSLQYQVNPSLFTGDAFTGSLLREGGENAGSYMITQGTLTAGSNYTINFNANNFLISKAPQSINFAALEQKTFGDGTFTLQGSASSNLILSYASNNTDVATVDGNLVTIVGAGTAKITASQGGNINYLAAAEVERSLVVNKAAQVITFPAIQDKSITDPEFSLEASSSSALAVTYTVSGPATLEPGNKIKLTGAGVVEIKANQAGNNNYQPALQVIRIFNVTTKQSQSISFAQLSQRKFDEGNFTLSANATSGLPVSFESNDNSIAEVNGMQVIVKRTGIVTITAMQAGNSQYNAALPVERSLNITKGNQTITFSALPEKTFGDTPFDLLASATSGLLVTYSSSNQNVATISGSTVKIVGVGSTVITAIQSGNENFLPAPEVKQTLTVIAKTQIIQLEGTLDFGEKIIGTGSYDQHLSIKNTGTGTLTITDITTPIGYTTDIRSGIIAAGEALTVKVTFTPAEKLQYDGILTVVSNASAGANTIGVKGKGVLITGIEENPVTNVTVFPNPSSVEAFIECDVNVVSVTMIDMSGKDMAIKTQRITGQKIRLDLDGYNEGIYLLKIATRSGISVKRLELLACR